MALCRCSSRLFCQQLSQWWCLSIVVGKTLERWRRSGPSPVTAAVKLHYQAVTKRFQLQFARSSSALLCLPAFMCQLSHWFVLCTWRNETPSFLVYICHPSCPIVWYYENSIKNQPVSLHLLMTISTEFLRYEKQSEFAVISNSLWFSQN